MTKVGELGNHKSRIINLCQVLTIQTFISEASRKKKSFAKQHESFMFFMLVCCRALMESL